MLKNTAPGGRKESSATGLGATQTAETAFVWAVNTITCDRYLSGFLKPSGERKLKACDTFSSSFSGRSGRGVAVCFSPQISDYGT